MKPIRNQCGKCKKFYDLTPANTTLHHVRKWPGMSFFEAKCPRNCDCVEWVFFIYLGELEPEKSFTLQEAFKLGFPTEYHDELSYDILHLYEEMSGKKLPEVQELLPRHEKQIAALHWELENCDGVDDILAIDVEAKLPKRWV